MPWSMVYIQQPDPSRSYTSPGFVCVFKCHPALKTVIDIRSFQCLRNFPYPSHPPLECSTSTPPLTCPWRGKQHEKAEAGWKPIFGQKWLALRSSRSEISGIRSPDVSCGLQAQWQGWALLALSHTAVWKWSLSTEPSRVALQPLRDPAMI